MKTIIGPDGSVPLPSEFREADAIHTGQTCEIERLGRGEYRLRIAATTGAPTAVDLLLACPVKDFFEPVEWLDMGDDLPPSPFQ